MDTKLLIHIWFAGSILLFIAVDFALRRYLRRNDVPLTWFWLGTPGYLDTKYAEWCRENKKSSAPIIILRVLLLGSIVLSAIYFKDLVVT